jgi:hypothetical protein
MGRRLLRGTFRVMGIILRYVRLFFPCGRNVRLGEGMGTLTIEMVLMNAGYLAFNYSRRDGDCHGSEWASGHCWEIFSSWKLQREDCL